jgi:VWFA-related protein
MMSAAFTSRIRFLLTAALLVCFARFLCAQQDAQSLPTAQLPESSHLLFKSTVNRVILDIAVTDSKGKPVHGLTQQDFSVSEDGQSQQILSFDVHDLEMATEFPKLSPLPPNTFVNVPSTPERGPLYVLLLDLVNTEAEDEGYARQQLLQFIRGNPQGTRFAIFVLSDGLHLVQGFTADQNQLYAVLDPSHPRSHIPRIFLYPRNYGRGDIPMMVSVLTFISRFLDGFPGRKNLIWLSSEFPLKLFPQPNVDPSIPRYIQMTKVALDLMAQGHVALYPLDVRGVPLRNPFDPMTGLWVLPSSYLLQDEIAKSTGGRAYHSDNGIKDLLDEAVEDGANYYTLTYSPSNRNYNGALRHIEVNLAKKGYNLSFPRSYYAFDVDAPLRHVSDLTQPHPLEKPGDSLYADMQHGAPLAHELYFRAHVHVLGAPLMATAAQMSNLEEEPAYFRVRRKTHPAKSLPPVRLQRYVIDYTFIANTPKPGSTSHAIRQPVLEVAVAAFGDDGRMLNGLVQKTSDPSELVNVERGNRVYHVQQSIDVPPGATSIRFAIRDVSTDRVGAMEVDLPLAPENATRATTSTQP